MGHRVIITGATGFVGEGVLFECLAHPAITEVLLVGRKPYEATNPKIRELILSDFLDLNAYGNELAGYDACFYCAGISSVGLSESEYRRVTYDVTVHFAERLAELNPQMTFCHVSGRNAAAAGGIQMWQRVKGETEVALSRLRFAKVYNFRPGFMRPTHGQRNTKTLYKVIALMYPVLRLMLPDQVCTVREVGVAMINSVLKGYPKSVLEVGDIGALAEAEAPGDCV